uniref:RE15062p n=1 Tax=Drosophila melanogaster TaxID=7227 RepID=Q7YU31_DROME|nr:RE15062p [Drosophila melanogaster]
MKDVKVARAISESSTTSDNTSDFIEIVKKYDVVYNNHNPDYKNVEVKLKVWTQIADEIGLSVEASKRKWKNLRDSYTKYLRSFRVGTKTSKKYQYWAHADHMDFLKPFQGPGRNSANGNGKSNDEDDTECDFGYQVLAKAASSGGEDELKITIATASAGCSSMGTHTVNTYTTALSSTSASGITSSLGATTPPNMISPGSNLGGTGGGSGSVGPQIHNSNSNGSATGSLNCAAVAPLSSMTPPATSGSNSAVVLPLPISPASSVAAAAAAVSKANANALASLANHLPMGLGVSGLAQQMFPLATLKAAAVAAGLPLPPTITPPGCSTGSATNSNVGCLIIEPHLFAAADNFKKELTAAAAAGAPLGLFQNLANQVQNANRLNGSCPSLPMGNPTPPPPPPAPPASKVRRVQPSPQTTAINLSCSGGNSVQTQQQQSMQMPQIQQQQQPSPAKTRKICDPRFPSDWDVSAVLQANRELDANTLFFLSLARQVRAMPMKFQSLAKMRCMRIVSDLELELENFDCNGGAPPPDDSGGGGAGNLKYCSIDTPPPPPQDGSVVIPPPPVGPEGSTEHFVYVMSPSRVESMIDISSDEEATMNGAPSTGQV